MKMRVARFTFGFALGAACTATAAGEAGLDRTTLPILEPKVSHSTVLDVRNAEAPLRFQVKAPSGAPNSPTSILSVLEQIVK